VAEVAVLAGEDPYAALRGFCDGISPADQAELFERRERLAEAMRRLGLDVLIFEAGLNMRHFSGVRWGRSERPVLYALFADGDQAWTGPAFEEGRLREGIGSDVELAIWQEQVNPYEACFEMLTKTGKKTRRVGLDPDMRLFVADGVRRAFRGAEFQPGAPAVSAVRMVKTAAELARLRRANEATKAALAHASGLITLGMPESAAKVIIREAQEAAGLRNIWVLALFGPNAAFPHGTSEERSLREGDMVLVDTGGDLHGYQSDITRTWAPAGASDDARRAWDTVLAAQSAALEEIRPGRSCALADAAARGVIAKAGFGAGYEQFTHRLGHGIGIQGHEEPYLRMNNAQLLEAGMTMSNEPGIYRPGAFGVRIEDIVAVTAQGAEVFGPRPHSLERPFG
jgi:Xaa-Pro dipeptidase